MKHRLVLAVSSSYQGVQPSLFCYWRRNNKTVEVFDEENSTRSPVKLMLFLHYLKCRKQYSSGQSCPQDCKSRPLKCNDYRSTDTDDLTNFVSLRKLIFTPLNMLYRALALCLLGVCCNFFLTLTPISCERWPNRHDVQTLTYSQKTASIYSMSCFQLDFMMSVSDHFHSSYKDKDIQEQMLEVSELIKITCSFCVHKSQDFAPFESHQHVGQSFLRLHTRAFCNYCKWQFHPEVLQQGQGTVYTSMPFNELG